MLVKGAMETPEFLLPVDALMLVPGQGTYTCCARCVGEEIEHTMDRPLIMCVVVMR
jgi:hypothetical protein